MAARTHQRAGLLCGLLTQQFLVGEFYSDSNLTSKLFVIGIFCLSTTIGSLLPDIDKPSSQIGSFFPFSSRLIARNFKHRTLTHSLLSIYFYIYTNLFLKKRQIVNIYCSRLESLEQSDAKASCVEG